MVSEASVDDDTLDAGQTTFLNYTVRNRGSGAAAGPPRVTAFRSVDATISRDDTSISTNTHVSVDSLGPGQTVSGSIAMPAAPSAGTWYYGACVDSPAGERDTANNCSTGVPVVVSGGSGGCPLDDLGTLSGTVTVTGTLDTDCVSPNYSGELARFYSFTLETPAAVEIDLVSSDFDAWLALREGADVEGRALVQDDDGGQGTNSRIATELAAGTYTIEATSFAAGDTGAFTLTVTAAGAGVGGCALDDLGAVSGTVMRVGDLGGDCESPSYPGRLARYYSFTLEQAGPVEIDLFSTAFDTFLALREGTDAAGPLVVSDDDGGEGTNSRIDRELAAGTYTIEATSYATGVTGAFTLTVTAAGVGAGGCALDDLGALSGTATRVGNLGDDCESPSYPGRLARYYSFTLGQAGPVEIDLVSSVFDAFLSLREGTDVAGRLVVSDDDGGEGTNSRIETELSAGTYTIEATSYATGVTGAFTLTVTAAGDGGVGGCALDDLGALSGTATRAGNLGDDCESPSYPGRLARYYSFTLGQAGPVEIDLVSSAFDTFLALREGTDVAGGLVASDDDGGQGTNSRIETDLAAGTYTIEATSYGTGVTGAFTLTVTGAGGGVVGGCALDDLGALSGTATRAGNLGGDCESPSYPGRLARYYSFTLGQAGPVEIDLVSSVFDTFVALRAGADVAGGLVVADDDGGQGTNSRIATELAAGTYTIEATSYGTGVTGAFTLMVTGAGDGGVGGCALDDLGGLSGTVTRLGNLGGDCESPSYAGRLARYYSFTLGQAGPVEIDLVSSAFDTWLALRQGASAAGGLVVADDDGGQGTNSRIAMELAAGTYTIEATSYGTGVTGAFTLTVTAAGSAADHEITLTDVRLDRVEELGATVRYWVRATARNTGSTSLPTSPALFASLHDGNGNRIPGAGQGVGFSGDAWPPGEERTGTGWRSIPAGMRSSVRFYRLSVDDSFNSFTTRCIGCDQDYVVPGEDGELTITSNGGGDRATITLPENRTQVTTVTASGGTPPYEFQWSSNAEAPDGLKFVMNTTTGALAFATAPDYENPTDSNGDNDYGVVVRVTDSSVPSQLDSQVITVTITDVAESDNDRAVLEALYHATGGPNWRNSTNWLTDAPLDEWAGVQTNDNGRVMSLELFSNQLTGSIPTSLGSLTNLEGLELGDNQLTGSIPSSLGSLTNLRILELYLNQLTGSIPSSLGSLSNLEGLGLGGNRLTGSIPPSLGSLSNLEGLGLGDNQLTGSIPSSLGSLTNLTDLVLHGNQLTGSIPSSLGSLTSLERLWLYDNQLTGSIPPSLGSPTNLRALLLGGNRLTGSIPSSLGSLTNLRILGLSGNQLTGSIPAELGNLANLQELVLSYNDLAGPIPAELGALANLEYLRFSSNQLTGSIPAELGTLANLEYLLLWSNQLTGPIPAGLGRLTALQALGLGENRLTGPIPADFGRLTALRSLRLRDNQLTGVLPRTLLQLALDEFEIAETQICVPSDAAFQQWLATIPNFTSSGLTCDADASDACRVGQELSPGDYCTVDIPNISVGTNRFEVRSDGLGCYGSICAGRSINLNGFEASRISGTSRWRIDAVPGGGTTNRPQSFSGAVGSAASFTDHPIVRGVTPIKAVHFAELRTRIDALRVGAGLARFQWTDPVLVRGVTPIRAVYLQELRAALGEAYVAAGRAAPGWTDADPTPGVTPIKAVYVMELRAAVVALE